MPRKSWIALFVTLILAMLTPVAAWAQPVPTLELRAGQDGPPVAHYIRYAKNIGDVDRIGLAGIASAPLVPVEGQAIHFGPPGTRTTLLLKVRNAGDAQASWIFTTGRGSLKYFRLYEGSGGRLKLLVDGADAAAASENLRTYQAFSTELVLDAGQEKLVIVDFLSENSTYMPIKIQTYGTFFKERRANIAMVSGVVLGIAVLIFLNFLFFSITGHREFLWLAVAQGFFAVNTIHSEGYVTIFFLADSPLISVAIEDMFKCGFAAAMAQFARSFLDTPALFPGRDIALRALILSALALMAAQLGLALYPPGLRQALHIAAWSIAVLVALFLPLVGYAAIRRLGGQLWPLLVGWGSLAAFIIYAAIASMGLFSWLPINWHLAGPIGLFESIMVTLALGLNLKKIQADKLAADAKYTVSMMERVKISERAARLAEEKSFALATVNSQNALLHASGHDSKQVILALNSAIDVLKRSDDRGVHGELTAMLQSSASYLNEIISTTISGANIVGSDSGFLALGSFKAEALIEPLAMMFRTPFAGKKLALTVAVDEDVTLISDKPLLMRALANLLSNCYKYTESGGARLTLGIEQGRAVIRIADTGIGMSPDIVRALNAATATRLRAQEDGQGSGSGFRSAKRLIEALSGSLEIAASSAAGTEIRVSLPCAFDGVEPCGMGELQAALSGWLLLDFDQRGSFDAALAAAPVPASRIVALTYDDTTVTRGRLSDMVGMMMIKPLCRELLEHPQFATVSEQI